MKKQAVFAFAALMSLSAAVRAAEVSFDGGKSGALDAVSDILDIVSDLSGDKDHHPGPAPQHPSQPGHINPGHPGDHHPVPPPPPPPQPWQPHPGPQPGHPVPPPYVPPHNPGWDHPNPPPPHYNFGGYRETCRTMDFTAQSPLSQTMDMILEEYGQDCQANHWGAPEYCRPTTNYHKRKVTVNIGPRQLEAWETERLELCMRDPKNVDVNLNGMLYQYAASVRNDDGLFKRATIVTLTPGAKKPAQASSDELSVGFTTVAPDGSVRLILADNRAQYFRGEKITITADGMRLAEITPNMPVEDLLNSFNKFNVTQAFDVAGTYELKIMDAPKPGKYVVTLKFFRSGPMSSGNEVTVTDTFELK